jgi:hypothetical protein
MTVLASASSKLLFCAVTRLARVMRRKCVVLRVPELRMIVLTERQASKLLLTLASTMILRSESHGTYDLILLPDGSGSLQTTSAVTTGERQQKFITPTATANQICETEKCGHGSRGARNQD